MCDVELYIAVFQAIAALAALFAAYNSFKSASESKEARKDEFRPMLTFLHYDELSNMRAIIKNAGKGPLDGLESNFETGDFEKTTLQVNESTVFIIKNSQHNIDLIGSKLNIKFTYKDMYGRTFTTTTTLETDSGGNILISPNFYQSIEGS